MATTRSRTSADPNIVLREVVATADIDPNRALARARAVVRDFPDLAIARRVLAATLRRVGNVTEAEGAERKAIEIGLRQPAAIAAEKALAEGRLEDAEQAIRPYLRENPEDAGAALILGTIAEQCGATKEAENLFRRAMLLAPAYIEARIALAKLFNGANRSGEALALLDEGLLRDPNHAAALSLKAGILVLLRRLEEADAIYRRLLEFHPRDGAGWMNFAHLSKTLGRVDEAIAAYRTAAAIDPTRGHSWWGLANLKTVKFNSDEIARMKAAVARTDVDEDDLIHLHFALGKALDDHGARADAFSQFAQASALRRAKAPHDAELVHANVQRVEEVFTSDFFAARRDAGSPSRAPIFIVSLPRSGSTLIEQILASHPAVEGTEELFDVDRIAGELAPQAPPGGYLDKIGDLTHSELRATGENYVEATARHRHSDRPHFTDKMPANWVYTGLIHTILPDAKIVDVRRHPLACGFANFAQHYNWGINYSYDLGDIGRFYSDYVRQMAHFDRVAPGLVHRVFHEQLIEDPEHEIRRLLDYLELPFDPACLRFHENKRPVHTPSSEQVRRPINRDGVDRWRNYEPWLDPLKAALGPVLTAYPDVPEHWPD